MMRIVYTLILFSAIVLNSIELSLQSGPNPKKRHIDLDLPSPSSSSSSSFRRISYSSAEPEPHLQATSKNPTVYIDLDPPTPSSPPSSSYPSERTPNALVVPQSQLRRMSPNAYARYLCDRSQRDKSLRTSPPVDYLSDNLVKEYELGRLGLNRLIPNGNPYHRLEFRRYTFNQLYSPAVFLHTATTERGPKPIIEKIVLTSYNGDILAIWETWGSLGGIYLDIKLRHRAKINIGSHAVSPMTEEEIKEAPVRSRWDLDRNFSVEIVTVNTLDLTH